MAKQIDITQIGGNRPGHNPKRFNEDAKQYMADNEIPEQEYLKDSDWNTAVDAIAEQQEADKKSIKHILFNNTMYNPESVTYNGVQYEQVAIFNQAGESDRYAIQLTSNVSVDKDWIIRKGETLPIKIRYNAIRQDTMGIQYNYQDQPGTLVITRKMSNAAATETVYTKTDISSLSTNTDQYNIDLDLMKYAMVGNQTLTLTVSTTYVDANNQTKNMYNSINFKLNVIELGVSNNYDWSVPINGSEGIFPIRPNVSGKVDKWLFYKITGKSQANNGTAVFTGYKQYSSVEEGTQNLIQISDTFNAGILNHGIHMVEMWVVCDDGSGQHHPDHPDVYNGIESEHIKYRVLVLNQYNVKEGEKTNLYIILQDVLPVMDNFAYDDLTQFCLWKSRADNLYIADTSQKYTVNAMVTDIGDGTVYTDTYAAMLYKGTDGEGVAIQEKVTVSCTMEIENDDDTIKEFQTAFRMSVDDPNTGEAINIINTSNFDINKYAVIRVINSADFIPTSGATFQLNPKTRNNSEVDWNTIKNTKKNNAVVESTWENFNHSTDGYVKDDDGIGVLRVLAGEKITITGDAANAFKAFATKGDSELTIEIDCKMRNITNLIDPVISLFETTGTGTTQQVLGLRMMPLEGLLTCGNNEQSRETHNFRWAENRRTHFTITLNPNVTTSDDDIINYQQRDALGNPYKNISLARVYINGVCNRAFSYTLSAGIWQTVSDFVEEGALQGKIGFILGQVCPEGSNRVPGVDLDIYSIRIYNTALSAKDILRNYISTKATSEEKSYLKEQNSITDADGRINRDLVHSVLKRNTLTLHSETEIWKGIESQKKNCYVEVRMFDKNTGEEDLVHGGTIGKQAYLANLRGEKDWTGKGALPFQIKSQGNTANTYYWHNWSGKANKIEFKMEIEFVKLHADFNFEKKEARFTKAATKGSDIGDAKYPLFYNGSQIQPEMLDDMTDEQLKAVTIVVDDGWWDWNGMYHGQFYKVSDDAPKAKKLCNKINYASSMAHHKMGSTALFSDVCRKILEKNNCLPVSHNGTKERQKNARFAVLEDIFFYFHQKTEDGKAYYHGPATFGAAKADKETCGYKEEDFPMMAMFEGADNNVPLADFRIPLDGDVFGYYNESKTDWSFAIKNVPAGEAGANELQFDYDLGYTKNDVGEPGLVGNAQKEAPTTEIWNAFAQFCNFWYCHNTRLQYFVGSFQQLKNTYRAADSGTQTAMRNTHYVCSMNYCVYRFNFTTNDFVDAGTWNRDTMSYSPGERNITTDPMTKSAYDDWLTQGTGDPSLLMKAINKAIARDIYETAGRIICVDSMLIHYNLINFGLAGTDNCSKNTYLVYAPFEEKKVNGHVVYQSDGKTPIYNYKWYFFADDADTVLPTDNNGQTTKEWFIDRVNDSYDFINGYKEHTDYEGKNSVMFNAIEDAYDDALIAVPGVSGSAKMGDAADDPEWPLQANMKEVLTAMQQCIEVGETIVGYESKQTLMACFHKYFLQWTNYIPIVAFNEAGRIRYEYPKSMNFKAVGSGSRGVDPIVQHMGDQRECELDWCERRSILLAIYANWGDFSGAVGNVGINEAAGAMSIDHQGVVNANAQSIDTEMIFELVPDRVVYPSAVQGGSVANPHIRIMPGQKYRFNAGTVSGDRGGSLLGLNYYTDIGNIGDILVSPNKTQSIAGSRLKKLTIIPTNNIADDGFEFRNMFSPEKLDITAPNLETVDVRSRGLKGSLDLSRCVRLKSVNTSLSKVSNIKFAECTTLNSITYGTEVTGMDLRGLINLKNISLGSWAHVSEIIVRNCSQETYDYVLANVPSLL